MEELYPAGTVLTAASVRALQKDRARIRRIVESKICEQLKTFEVTGRNIVIAEVICSYVDAILEADAASLAGGGTLRILGVEQRGDMDFGGFNFIGFIDRLDSVAPGQLRVVDYKTGSVEDKDLWFGTDPADIPKIGLQLWVYKKLVERKNPGADISGAIYQPGRLMSGDNVITSDLDASYCSRMETEVLRVLGEISDLSVPWTRTSDEKKCAYCDFRAICGR